MADQIAMLNVVIAELNLVAARLSAGAAATDVASLLDQAKVDLAAAARKVQGLDPIRGDEG